MSTTEPTTATKVMMLGHVIAGKDLDFVASVTGLSRDTVLDIVSAHGYPKINSMKWSIDCLIKDTNKIPTRQADSRPHVLLDEPTTNIRSDQQRAGSLAITPPATIAHIPPATADLLHQAEQSPFIRTQNLAAKIHTLLADLTTRLADEQAAAEAKAQADRESARIASRIATLQAEIDKLKRKPAKKPSVAKSARSYTRNPGEYSCPLDTCNRTFDTTQGASTHRRRAHEGFTPTRKAIAS